MSTGFEKVNKIKKFASNTVDDYYRLMIIENWGFQQPLDDKVLDLYLKRMHELMPRYNRDMSPGDLAFILCTESLNVSTETIRDRYIV